jgi:hypothetical protein
LWQRNDGSRNFCRFERRQDISFFMAGIVAGALGQRLSMAQNDSPLVVELLLRAIQVFDPQVERLANAEAEA